MVNDMSQALGLSLVNHPGGSMPVAQGQTPGCGSARHTEPLGLARQSALYSRRRIRGRGLRCPCTPVTGSARWCGSVSTHRHAPGCPSTSARVTWPMIAELTSCPPSGHSSAGADKSLSLLVWIHRTPRQEGFQVRSTTSWSPVTMRHVQGFVTLITRAGSAVTGRSQLGRPARGGTCWRMFSDGRSGTGRRRIARSAGRRVSPSR
jgi:hypothetical protein